MDLQQLKTDLLENKTRHLYIFTGSELALQDIYIAKIAEISKLAVNRVDTLASIMSNLKAKSLIKTTPVIYVIRNDEDYLKAEKSWKEILAYKSFRGNIVILLYSNTEKLSKFCKVHEEILTQFDLVSESLLKNRLQATTGMPPAYCADIVKMCGNNYGRIKNELYKLCTYATIHNYDWNTAYLYAKKLNLIHEEIGDIIFDFTNAIAERNIKKAYVLWEKMKYTGEGAIKVLSILYNTFRQILMVQSTPNDQKTEQVLGMSQAQIYVANQKCNKYNIYEIVNIVKTLRYLEKGIKVGTIEEQFAIPYLMGVIW